MNPSTYLLNLQADTMNGNIKAIFLQNIKSKNSCS